MTVRAAAAVAALLLTACAVPSDSNRADPLSSEVSVASVTDGDTVVLGDGTVVRLDGINAPESEECLATEAADELARLIRDPVALVATGEDQYGRVLGELVAGGTSVNEMLVSRGMAISTAAGPDPSRLREAEADARRAKVGIWDPDACGSGPLPPVEIVWLEADPPGPDGESGSEERVVLAPSGDSAVDVSGWILRDESSLHRFVFPAGSTIADETTIVVSRACTEIPSGAIAWCSGPVWNNDGDTAFLTEPGGRIVAWLRFAR